MELDIKTQDEIRTLVRAELDSFEWRVRCIVNDELKNLIDEVGAALRQNPRADFIDEAHSHIFRQGQTLSKLGH